MTFTDFLKVLVLDTEKEGHVFYFLGVFFGFFELEK